MSVSVVEWLLNFGVAGVVLLLLTTGLLVPGFIYKDLQRANEKLGDALAVERQRNADLQQLAATGVHALNAMREVAEERRSQREGELAQGRDAAEERRRLQEAEERELMRHVARAPVESGGDIA